MNCEKHAGKVARMVQKLAGKMVPGEYHDILAALISEMNSNDGTGTVTALRVLVEEQTYPR